MIKSYKFDDFLANCVKLRRVFFIVFIVINAQLPGISGTIASLFSVILWSWRKGERGRLGCTCLFRSVHTYNAIMRNDAILTN